MESVRNVEVNHDTFGLGFLKTQDEETVVVEKGSRSIGGLRGTNQSITFLS